MKLTSARIKTFVVLLSVLFVVTVLKANSEKTFVNPTESSSIEYAARDKSIYTKYCARCHGADGRAQTPKGKQTGATNFTNPKWQAIEARGIRTITNGKEQMPSFKDKLSAEQIRSVWNYVRGFKKQ